MTPDDTFIRSQRDLETVWSTLMQPLGFSRRSVWMLLIDPDDRPVPQLVEIDECDDPPTEEMIAGFADFLRHLHSDLAPAGRFAFLRSRPGAGGVTDDDRAWARGLYAACRQAGVPVEVVHRACDVDVLPVPLDEVQVA